MAPIILFIKSKFLSFAPSSPFSWPQIFPKASLCCCLLSSPAEKVTKVKTLSTGQPFQGVPKGYQSASVCTWAYACSFTKESLKEQTERRLGNSKILFKNRSQNGSTSCYVITYGKLPICLKVTLLSVLTGHFNALCENIMIETSSQSRGWGLLLCFCNPPMTGSKLQAQTAKPHRNQSWQFRDTGIKR